MFHIYFLGSSRGPALRRARRRPSTPRCGRRSAGYLRRAGCRRPHRHAGRAVIAPAARRLHASHAGGRASRPTPSCSPPTSAGCSASSRALARLGDAAWRERLGRAAARAPPFAGLAALARPAGRARTGPRSSARAGSARSTTSACWSASRARRRAGRARTGGSVVELHAYALPRRPTRTRVRERAASTQLDAALPRARRRATSSTRRTVRGRLPAVRHRGRCGDAARASRTPDPRARAGRRPGPLRLPGGADGTRRHHRLPRRRTRSGTVGRARPRPLDGAAPGHGRTWSARRSRPRLRQGRGSAEPSPGGAQRVAPLGVGQVVDPQPGGGAPHRRPHQRPRPRRATREPGRGEWAMVASVTWCVGGRAASAPSGVAWVSTTLPAPSPSDDVHDDRARVRADELRPHRDAEPRG